MKKMLMIIAVMILAVRFGFSLTTVEQFRKIDQWNHGDREIYDIIIDPLIDQYDHVVARIGGKAGSVIITPKRVVFFAPFGQGPSDLYLMMAMCPYGEDIAFLEYPNKIKIFTSKDNTYVWKATRWLKQEYFPIVANDVLYIKDQWVLGGFFLLKKNNKKQLVALMKIYNEKGNPIKQLIEKELPFPNSYLSMDTYLASYHDRLFFVVENELKVYEILASGMELKRKIPLTVPPFYKKMPPDYYESKQYTDDKEYDLDYEKWKTTYSRITRVSVEDNYLAIQIRTFGKDQKKFAMLFYSIEDFGLKYTFPIDDLFLGARNGVYYFYRNGNPGYDEDTDECVIHLYSFRETK